MLRCIRTCTNTGQNSWRIIHVLVSCQGAFSAIFWRFFFETCTKTGAEGTCAQLFTVAYHCHHHAMKVLFTKRPKGHKCAQLQMIVHELQRAALSPLFESPHFREAPVRFGSVMVCAWDGSSGSGFRFRWFLCKKGFSVFQYSLIGKDGSGSGFGSWKTVPAVPVPLSVSGKTVPTIPVSGSGSVPEPPCHLDFPQKTCDVDFAI